MFHTYILFSESLQKFYVGSTQHLWIRLEEHNRGKSTFTKTGAPWQLMYAIQCEDLPGARELETKIKKRGAERFLDSLYHNICSAC